MTRIISLVIIFGVIIIAYFAITQYRNTYKILPANLPPAVQVKNYEDWHEFTPPTNKFSVLLPVLPQSAKEKVQGRKYEMYVSEKSNGTIFMISLIDFTKPIVPEQTHVILNAIMEDLLSSNSENELRSSQMETFENHDALDFTIVNKEIVMDGKAFMQGNTLFLLTRVSKVEDQSPEEFDFFINSFHLLPQANGAEAKQEQSSTNTLQEAQQ